jgi:hypothetical protein
LYEGAAVCKSEYLIVCGMPMQIVCKYYDDDKEE